MKKRWIALLLTLVMLLSACSAKQPDTPEPTPTPTPEPTVNQAELTDKSLAYAAQFREGNFDDFYADIPEEIAGNVAKEDIVSVWNELMGQAGAFVQELEQTYEKQDGYLNITLRQDFENFDVLVVFVYDASGAVQALQFYADKETLKAPEPTVTDTFEEVALRVGYIDDKQMNGMLTLPKSASADAPVPVVILVQGSGPSDMDETIGAASNKPMRDLAHGLAQQGIASIRYDKRYYIYSPEDLSTVTIEDEVLNDVYAAIDIALADERLSDDLYVIGHSLGGMLTPKIATDRPEVKGIVSMAGTLRKLEDLIYDQNMLALEQTAELTDEQKGVILAQINDEIKKIKTLSPDEMNTTILDEPASYWNSLNAIDAPALALALDIPMLILQGSTDLQVYPETDYALWQTTLEGKKNVTFQLYEGLNHLFMPASSDTFDETLYDAPANVSEQVIDDIANWVNNNSK